MKLDSGWLLVLVVVGVLAFIVSPITAPLWVSLIIIGIIAAGYLVMKFYILPDDKDDEKGKD